MWNEIPNSSKNIPRKTFRNKGEGEIINILKTDDNYIDNDKIIGRLKKYLLTTFLSIYNLSS